MSEATKRPWKLIEGSDSEIVGANNESICGDTQYYPWAPSIEDMRLIVKAVNNFDQMREALEAISRCLCSECDAVSIAKRALEATR